MARRKLHYPDPDDHTRGICGTRGRLEIAPLLSMVTCMHCGPKPWGIDDCKYVAIFRSFVEDEYTHEIVRVRTVNGTPATSLPSNKRWLHRVYYGNAEHTKYSNAQSRFVSREEAVTLILKFVSEHQITGLSAMNLLIGG